MAHPPGMELHGSGWRINKRVPTALLQHYAPKKILHYQTGVQDRKAADVLAWRWLAEMAEEFARIRETGTKYKTTIEPYEVSRLVRLMVRSSLETDEESRASGLYADDEEFEDSLRRLDSLDADTRTALSRRIFAGDLPLVVEDWLTHHGYSIPHDSEAFKGLCLEFAKGRAEAVRLRRAKNAGEDVELPPVLAPADALKDAPASAPMLSAVIKSFLSKQDDSRPMFKKYAAGLELLQEVLGDRPVSSLKQADIDDFCTLLCRLPPRWKDEKRKKKLGVRELAALEWAKVINGKTFKDSYLAALRPFLVESKRLFGDQGFPPHLTTDGIKYSGDREGGENKQRAMTLEELKRLFEGPEIRAFAADPEQAHCYWLPLIGLYTGARVNEVCQLNPQHDILEEGGVWCFNFTEETAGDARIVKSLKNKTSIRKVPIHSRLLELGILGYTDKMREGGHALLFPQWPPVRGKASGKAEKWFREYIEKLGLRDETPGKRLVGFHAFRSTFLNRALNLGIQDAECLTGHVKENVSAVVRGYQGEVEPAKKQETLEMLTYELDIPAPGV